MPEIEVMRRRYLAAMYTLRGADVVLSLGALFFDHPWFVDYAKLARAGWIRAYRGVGLLSSPETPLPLWLQAQAALEAVELDALQAEVNVTEAFAAVLS